jgi:pimeloyl-ACP methyl ester carboxylesterase
MTPARCQGEQLGAADRATVLDGRRLCFIDRGAGTPLLLVHGLGASSHTWCKTVPDLARDHRVVAVDLPGFGGSAPLPARSCLDDYARTLVRLLDRLGLSSVLAVGHSLGGLITQSLTGRHPERVEALILVGCGDGAIEVRRAAAFRRAATMVAMARRVGPPAFIADRAFQAAMTVAPLRRRLVSHLVHDPSVISSKLAAELLTVAYAARGITDAVWAGLQFASEPSPGDVSCPTLIINGSRDRLIPATAGARLAERIPAARLEIWNDVGHHPMLERPAEFNARLRAFSQDRHEVPAR